MPRTMSRPGMVVTLAMYGVVKSASSNPRSSRPASRLRTVTKEDNVTSNRRSLPSPKAQARQAEHAAQGKCHVTELRQRGHATPPG